MMQIRINFKIQLLAAVVIAPNGDEFCDRIDVEAKFACAKVRGAYTAASRIAFEFGKIVDYYHETALNLIKIQRATADKLRARHYAIGVKFYKI